MASSIPSGPRASVLASMSMSAPSFLKPQRSDEWAWSARVYEPATYCCNACCGWTCQQSAFACGERWLLHEPLATSRRKPGALQTSLALLCKPHLCSFLEFATCLTSRPAVLLYRREKWLLELSTGLIPLVRVVEEQSRVIICCEVQCHTSL